MASSGCNVCCWWSLHRGNKSNVWCGTVTSTCKQESLHAQLFHSVWFCVLQFLLILNDYCNKDSLVPSGTGKILQNPYCWRFFWTYQINFVTRLYSYIDFWVCVGKTLIQKTDKLFLCINQQKKDECVFKIVIK